MIQQCALPHITGTNTLSAKLSSDFNGIQTYIALSLQMYMQPAASERK